MQQPCRPCRPCCHDRHCHPFVSRTSCSCTHVRGCGGPTAVHCRLLPLYRTRYFYFVLPKLSVTVAMKLAFSLTDYYGENCPHPLTFTNAVQRPRTTLESPDPAGEIVYLWHMACHRKRAHKATAQPGKAAASRRAVRRPPQRSYYS